MATLKTRLEAEISARDNASATIKAAGRSARGLGEDLDDAGKKAGRAQGRFARFASFLKSRFVVTLGDAAQAVKAVFRQIEESAKLDGQTESVKRNLAEQGIAFDAYIAKLEEVSRGQVSTADLIKSSSQALLLGIPAEEIANLLEIARVSAIATGQDVGQAFEDIATGIGRASPMILDNLGITVKLETAYQNAAIAAGKTTQELSEQEKKAALLNEVLRIGTERVEQFGDAQSETSAAILQGKAAMDDFTVGAGRVAAALAGNLAAILTATARGFLVMGEAIAAVFVELGRMSSDLPLIGDRMQAMSQSALRVERAFDQKERALLKLTKTLSASSSAQWESILGLEKHEEVTNASTRATKAHTRATEASAAAADSFEQSEREATDALTEQNEQLETGADLLADYSGGMGSAASAARELARAEREQLTALRQTNTERERSQNLLGGASEFSQIGGGSFSAPASAPADSRPWWLRPAVPQNWWQRSGFSTRAAASDPLNRTGGGWNVV